MTAPGPTDAQRRLVAVVAQRLPVERVRELYLFAPMRQGGVETGLAVIAAGEPEAEPDAQPEDGPNDGPNDQPERESEVEREVDPEVGPEVEREADSDAASDVVPDAQPDAAPDAEREVERESEPEEAESIPDVDLALAAGPTAGDAPCDPTEDAAGPAPTEGGEGVADVPVTGEPAAGEPVEAGLVVAEESVTEEAAANAPAASPARERFTVYTARYRLQLKGPDRGKWEVEVVAEADAPLLTVDAVVRGVQRRLGELAEVERLSAADFRRLLAEGV